MKRRDTLPALLALATTGTALRGFAQQQSAKVARIGFLGATSRPGYEDRVEALLAGLHNLGHVAGKNLAIEFRWAEGKYDRLPELAAELARFKVDIIVTHGTPGTRAAKQATATIPIVMATCGDAVASGIISSLARPGGNVTGNTFFSPELIAKRLELLKEMLPRIARVGALLNPDNPFQDFNSGPGAQAMKAAGIALKIAIEPFEARSITELDGVFAAMTRKQIDAVEIFEDGVFIANAKAISALAEKHKLPSVGFKEFAEAGGLLGYGVNFNDQFRRAAYFVDKILKGDKPSDIPVEQPTRFECVVNLKTAKALGIRIPPTVMLRADKVIE